MIIARKDFLSNSVRIIAIIFDVFITLGAITLLILAIIGQFDEHSWLYVLSTIFWVSGLFSIGDFISLCRLGQPIVYRVYIKLRFHYGKRATPEQKQVLDNIFANSEEGVAHISVLIYGKPYSGKSESVNFIIDHILRNFILQKKQFINGYEYIDCYNDAHTVSDHINKLPLHAVNNKILIFDNINEADGSAIERLIQICQKRNCCILVIEENGESVLQKLKEDCVAESSIEFHDNNFSSLSQTLSVSIAALKGNKYVLNILLAIAILSRYHNICNLTGIRKLSQLHGKQPVKLNGALKKLEKLNLIEKFPINSTYYRLNSGISSDEFLFALFPLHELRDEKLIKYRDLFSPTVGEEIRWLNLLDLPAAERSIYCFRDHIDLFSMAIAHANFIKLYNALKAFYQRNGNCHEFLYEEGYLSYILNDFTKAISCFEDLICLDLPNKMNYEFKLIEALHGSCDATIVEKVQFYINDLLACKELSYRLYGQYWIQHMESERGNFNIAPLNKIRNSLIELYKAGYDDDLILCVIERCFTDQLRMYWMSGTLTGNQNQHLKDEFKEIFSSKSNYQYYLLLYFQAGFYHYHSVCASFLKKGNREIEDAANLALTAYEAAIASDYQKLKSKAAAAVKLVDLKAIFSDAEFEDLIQEVKRFRQDAEKNRIDVFIAFSDSLIGKLRILDQCISDFPRQENASATHEIFTALDNSEKIYALFKNEYGVMRARILKSLYRLLLSFSNGNQAIGEAKFALKSIFIKPDWSIEKEVVESMNRSNLKYKDVCDCIKFYPIILQ